MSEYYHPDDFDLLLKTTPYTVWMWLKKETKYEPPWKTYLDPPTLSPPEFWNRNPSIPSEYSRQSAELKYTKTVFRNPEKARKPRPFASDAHFALEALNLCYKEKEDRDASDWYRTVGEVIRIFIKSDEEGLTRVVGEYTSDWPELVEYMKQIRDALVKKFPEVGGEDHTQGKIKKGETRIQKKDAGRPPDPRYDEAYNRLSEGEDVTSVFDWWCEKENVDIQDRKQFILDRKRFKKAMKYREKTQN